MRAEGNVSFLFERDPLTRTTTLFHWEDEKQRFHLEEIQDVEPILNAAKREASLTSSKSWGTRKTREMHKAATIPMIVLAELRRQWRLMGLDHDGREREMKRWLNDPDNKFFRVDDGRRI